MGATATRPVLCVGGGEERISFLRLRMGFSEDHL